MCLASQAATVVSDGFATASLDELAAGAEDRCSVTATLGCTEVGVDAHRLAAGETAGLPTREEVLCVPVEGSEPLVLDSSVAVPPAGVGRAPAGRECSVRCEGVATVVVVRAPAEPDPGSVPTAVDVESSEFATPPTSDVATAHLTEALGCTGTKVNARLLEPGQAVPYHTEGDQEELFVPVRGPAAMRIAGERRRTPPGTVTRVAPSVPRSAVNDGDTDALWIMVGAPPTGGPTGWDPGAEILE